MNRKGDLAIASSLSDFLALIPLLLILVIALLIVNPLKSEKQLHDEQSLLRSGQSLAFANLMRQTMSLSRVSFVPVQSIQNAINDVDRISALQQLDRTFANSATSKISPPESPLIIFFQNKNGKKICAQLGRTRDKPYPCVGKIQMPTTGSIFIEKFTGLTRDNHLIMKWYLYTGLASGYQPIYLISPQVYNPTPYSANLFQDGNVRQVELKQQLDYEGESLLAFKS